jgi:hypothetical protein
VEASAPSYFVTARVYLNFSMIASIMATGLGTPTPVTLSQPLVSVRLLSRPKTSNKVVSCRSFKQLPDGAVSRILLFTEAHTTGRFAPAYAPLRRSFSRISSAPA